MKYLLSIIFLSTLFEVVSQQRVAVSYFDVGRLYDTVPSPFYDDKAYTPKGRYRWSQGRYRDEIERVTAVIDSMRFPIVAIYGVENEGVVRDIVELSNQDYSYIHRDLDYYDGLDFALLYYGDQLFLQSIVHNNTWLYISGEMFGVTIDINLTRRGDKIRTISPPNNNPPSDITLLVGQRLYRGDIYRLGMVDLLRDTELKGGGDTRGDKGWYLNSRFGAISNLPISRSGIYITDWLINQNMFKPHLPQFVIFDVEGN
ncbi:MAG: hypothetical protein SNF68_07600 [Rikenellaceae bacterium]